MGSTLLSSTFWSECMSVCVFLRSLQGLFQLRAKNTEKLWKSFYVLLSEMILRKAFSWGKKKNIFHIQKGTYPITELPSSISTSINPSSILRLCVEALPWAKSMSLVVVNVGHVSDDTVSQPFVTTFWLHCKSSTRKKHFQLLISSCWLFWSKGLTALCLFLKDYFWLVKLFKKTKRSFLWFSHIDLGKISPIQMKLILCDKSSE